MMRPSGVSAFLAACVAQDAVAHLLRQVEFLKQVHHAQALLIVAEAERADLGQRALARMAERRMSEIVA